MNEKKIRELAMEYGLKCDPKNQTLEKQADIRQGFIEGMKQALILCGVVISEAEVCSCSIYHGYPDHKTCSLCKKPLYAEKQT